MSNQIYQCGVCKKKPTFQSYQNYKIHSTGLKHQQNVNRDRIDDVQPIIFSIDMSEQPPNWKRTSPTLEGTGHRAKPHQTASTALTADLQLSSSDSDGPEDRLPPQKVKKVGTAGKQQMAASGSQAVEDDMTDLEQEEADLKRMEANLQKKRAAIVKQKKQREAKARREADERRRQEEKKRREAAGQKRKEEEARKKAAAEEEQKARKKAAAESRKRKEEADRLDAQIKRTEAEVAKMRKEKEDELRNAATPLGLSSQVATSGTGQQQQTNKSALVTLHTQNKGARTTYFDMIFAEMIQDKNMPAATPSEIIAMAATNAGLQVSSPATQAAVDSITQPAVGNKQHPPQLLQMLLPPPPPPSQPPPAAGCHQQQSVDQSSSAALYNATSTQTLQLPLADYTITINGVKLPSDRYGRFQCVQCMYTVDYAPLTQSHKTNSRIIEMYDFCPSCDK